MTDQPKRPTCRSCDCYRADPTQLLRGVCVCLPPTPIMISQPDGSHAGLIGVYPPVGVDNFCHQWRPRPDATAQPAANDAPAPGPPFLPPQRPSWEP